MFAWEALFDLGFNLRLGPESSIGVHDDSGHGDELSSVGGGVRGVSVGLRGLIFGLSLEELEVLAANGEVESIVLCAQRERACPGVGVSVRAFKLFDIV